MRLRQVSWENYRRLPDGRIEVRNHLVLVGPNDSGKSSVLRAINLCLGTSGAQLNATLEPRDFTDPGRPIVLQVVLVDFDEDDRAAFPDEISTIDGESLTVEIVATMEGDAEQKQVLRRFPFSGHNRSASRVQMDRFGWAYVPASRSLYRDLGTGATSVVRNLLSTVDLEGDRAAFEDAATAFRDALDNAAALAGFRTDLAGALSDALPRSIDVDDVALTSEADLADDPLSGVTITVEDGGHRAPLAEQSDGVRALSVLTLLGMTHQGAQIVGIDEPEIHLHHTAQRAIAARLRTTPGQRVLVTHAPAVVQEMDPLDIVAMSGDKVARQLPLNAPMANLADTTRFWAPNLIEPLTSRAVLLVEGASDRIVCDLVARLIGVDLNRTGVSTFDMGGSGMFARAYGLFGPAGFDLPLFGVLDEDARTRWSEVLDVDPSDIEADGHYVVCNPELEDVYVNALGVERMLELLLASPTFTEGSIRQACGGIDLADMTLPTLASYCSHDKRKIPAALALVAGVTPGEAETIEPVATIVRAASA